jgi:hypothetical protein
MTIATANRYPSEATDHCFVYHDETHRHGAKNGRHYAKEQMYKSLIGPRCATNFEKNRYAS